MNNIVQLRTRCAIVALLGLLLLSGCGTTSGPITKAALTSAVAIGEEFAIEQHPETIPYLKVAADVVCATANGTNASPDNIVKALNAAGVTNAETRLIVNGSLAVYDVVYASLGTNQTQIAAYAKALCDGMQLGLPVQLGRRLLTQRNMPPHLK